MPSTVAIESSVPLRRAPIEAVELRCMSFDTPAVGTH